MKLVQGGKEGKMSQGYQPPKAVTREPTAPRATQPNHAPGPGVLSPGKTQKQSAKDT